MAGSSDPVKRSFGRVQAGSTLWTPQGGSLDPGGWEWGAAALVHSAGDYPLESGQGMGHYQPE